MHRDWYNTVQCNDRLWGTDPARWGEPADVQPADPPTVPATATLLRDGSQRQWLLKITCPFCGKTHTHGGGDGETPAGYYGHRVAHCHGYASHPGYVLTDEHGGQP